MKQAEDKIGEAVYYGYILNHTHEVGGSSPPPPIIFLPEESSSGKNMCTDGRLSVRRASSNQHSGSDLLVPSFSYIFSFFPIGLQPVVHGASAVIKVTDDTVGWGEWIPLPRRPGSRGGASAVS